MQVHETRVEGHVLLEVIWYAHVSTVFDLLTKRKNQLRKKFKITINSSNLKIKNTGLNEHFPY
jgi:hypothetical protein